MRWRASLAPHHRKHANTGATEDPAQGPQQLPKAPYRSTGLVAHTRTRPTSAINDGRRHQPNHVQQQAIAAAVIYRAPERAVGAVHTVHAAPWVPGSRANYPHKPPLLPEPTQETAPLVNTRRAAHHLACLPSSRMSHTAAAAESQPHATAPPPPACRLGRRESLNRHVLNPVAQPPGPRPQPAKLSPETKYAGCCPCVPAAARPHTRHTARRRMHVITRARV